MSNIYIYLIPALLQLMKIVFNHFSFGSVNPTSCPNFLFTPKYNKTVLVKTIPLKKGDEFWFYKLLGESN